MDRRLFYAFYAFVTVESRFKQNFARDVHSNVPAFYKIIISFIIDRGNLRASRYTL